MDKYIKHSQNHQDSDASPASDTKKSVSASDGLDAALANFKATDASDKATDASAAADSSSKSRTSSGSSQVVDVRLSSELQQALLQGKGMHAKSRHKTKNAPNVEEEVAKERQMDVYIHDGFGAAEKTDVKAVKEVNANKDMKP